MKDKVAEETKTIESQTKQDETVTAKKVYVAPKLSYEGKWDTVTMQFGGSFAAPP